MAALVCHDPTNVRFRSLAGTCASEAVLHEGPSSVILPTGSSHRRRRKALKPSRAPEAACDSWYEDVQQRLQAPPPPVEPSVKRSRLSLSAKGASPDHKPAPKPTPRTKAARARKLKVTSAERPAALPTIEAKPSQEALPQAGVPVAEANTAVPLPAADWIPVNEPEPVHGDRRPGSKECYVCGATKTPMWRREGRNSLCNACGLRTSRAAAAAMGRPRSDRGKRKRSADGEVIPAPAAQPPVLGPVHPNIFPMLFMPHPQAKDAAQAPVQPISRNVQHSLDLFQFYNFVQRNS